MSNQDEPAVRVWDPLVRIGHWELAGAFFVAYLLGDEQLGIHVGAGYVAGTIVLIRVIWGLVGTRRARFHDFIYRPATVLGYLRDLVMGRARRYLGHSPGGGAMVVALLAAIVVTVGTGLVVYAEDDGAGPLSGVIAQVQVAAPTVPMATDLHGFGNRERRPESAIREVHDLAANLTLFLIIFHVLGVLLASFAHRENLIRSMVTGDKRPLLPDVH